MSWEQILKDQSQRATNLVVNSLSRLRQALDALNPPTPLPPGELADRVTRHLVLTWKESLDLTFGLLGRGAPVLPIMFFTSASGPNPTGSVRLATDTTVPDISFTPLFHLGGGSAIPAASFTVLPGPTVTDGSLLTITMRPVPMPPFNPATVATGLYHGVAIEATQPVAVILFQKL